MSPLSLKSLSLFLFFAISPLPSAFSQNNPVAEQSVMATLWYQKSAERIALCYQAFNVATDRLTRMLDTLDKSARPAVITDIDETILDNSRSEAQNILDGSTYSSDRWKAWTDLAIADPIPGSLEFARFCEEHGVEVFYISNRKTNEAESTLKNLAQWGYPYADSAHLLLRASTSSKNERRSMVGSSHTILLLLGDNLADFDGIFEDRTGDFGFGQVTVHRDLFGKRFIVLPNPIYGDWTRELTLPSNAQSPDKAAEAKKKWLTGIEKKK